MPKDSLALKPSKGKKSSAAEKNDKEKKSKTDTKKSANTDVAKAENPSDPSAPNTPAPSEPGSELPPYNPDRPIRKTLSDNTIRETRESLTVSQSQTKVALAANPRLSHLMPVDLVQPPPPDAIVESKPNESAERPSVRISQESLKEAESLLNQMSSNALLTLKRLLRAKAKAVENDLDLLQQNEKTLLELSDKLQKEKKNLEGDKQKASDVLASMRDNLCKVSDFNQKTFALKGQAVIADAVKDQWSEKAEMLERMEQMIQQGIEEDNRVSKQIENSEKQWQQLMLDYMTCEKQIVSSKSRLEDLEVRFYNTLQTDTCHFPTVCYNEYAEQISEQTVHFLFKPVLLVRMRNFYPNGANLPKLFLQWAS